MKEIILAPPVLRFDVEDIPRIFFTSDWHLNHTKIIQYCNRPFKDAEEMNKTIIENTNAELSKVKDPILINCGDFIFGQVSTFEELMGSIKASRIYNVIGNHDFPNVFDKRVQVQQFSNIGWNTEYVIEIYDKHKKVLTFTVSHYPKPFNMFYGAFNIHGHLHEIPNMEDMTGSDKNKAEYLIENGDYYDVGVDGNNFKPVKLSSILKGQTTMPKLKHLDYDKWKNIINDIINKNNA